MMNPAAQLAACHAEIGTAARLAGREPAAVKLIAVSKTFPPDTIELLLAAGQRRFGENRVQEAAQKWPPLKRKYPDIELHLLGPLQKNKINKALALFDVFHTVDSEDLADALQKRRRGPRPLTCLLQVNTGAEIRKAGVSPARLAALHAHIVRQCPDLDIRGLMAIPPADQAPEPHFLRLGELAAALGVSELSIGMSADFQVAITCGATYIRIGTRLFGSR